MSGPRWPGRNRRPRSLSAQLTARNVLLLAVGLLLAGSVAAGALHTMLINEVDARIRSSLDELEAMDLTFTDLQRLDALAGRLTDELGAVPGSEPGPLSTGAPMVLGADGKPAGIAFGGPAERTPEAAAHRRALAATLDDPAAWARDGDIRMVHLGQTEYRVKVVELQGGGYAVSYVSTDEVRENVADLVLVQAVASTVLLSLLAVASRVTSRRRLRPLGDMVDVASALAEGEPTAGALARRVEPRTGNGRDAAEVERLRTALNAMLHQIGTAFETRERSHAQLRRFAADASHELRTPLTSVRGYLQLYERGMLDDPDERSTALARMTAETERMAHLVDELLALARLDQAPEVRPRPVDLARVAGEALADLSAQQPGRPVEWAAPEDGCRVLADEAVLRQIVGNLFANVRVHTPPGTPVRVSLAREGAHGVLRVADAGPGMRREDAERVFDRFFRAAADRQPGSGLGMSVVQAGCAAQGGTARVETAPGEGMTVTVALPAAKPPATTAERTAATTAGPVRPAGTPASRR